MDRKGEIMEDWKENIVDELKRKMECDTCPLSETQGGDCNCHNYIDCESMWKEFLFNKVDDDEEEETEETMKEKKEESEIPDGVIWRLVHGINTELRWEKPQEEKPFGKVTIHMGDFHVDGVPRDIAEFLRQAGERLAP